MSNPRGGSSPLEAEETYKTEKSLKNLKMQFCKKNAKICDIKKLNVIPWQIKFFSVTYCQILKNAFWPLCLERDEKYFKKIVNLHVLSNKKC